jgi:hypothetical protein
MEGEKCMLMYDGFIECKCSEVKSKIIDGLTDADYATWVMTKSTYTASGVDITYAIYYLKRKTLLEKL